MRVKESRGAEGYGLNYQPHYSGTICKQLMGIERVVTIQNII